MPFQDRAFVRDDIIGEWADRTHDVLRPFDLPFSPSTALSRGLPETFRAAEVPSLLEVHPETYLERGPLRKALRLGFAVLTGAPLVYPSEMPILRRAIPEDGSWDERRVSSLVRRVAATPTEVVAGWSVDFVVPFGRRNARALASGKVFVARVEPDLTTPAYALPTPEGHDLVVLEHGGRFLRPVLAPGSWRPVTLAEFAVASAGGDCWADAPYLPRPPFVVEWRSPAVKALGEGLGPARADGGGRPGRAAAEEAVAVAGGLACVDGFVYREVDGPTRRIVVEVQPGSGDRVRSPMAVTWAWTVGDLRETDEQNPFPLVGWRGLDWGGDWLGEGSATRDDCLPALEFGLDEGDALVAATMAVASRAGVPYVRGSDTRLLWDEPPAPIDPAVARLAACVPIDPVVRHRAGATTEARWARIEDVLRRVREDAAPFTLADPCDALASVREERGRAISAVGRHRGLAVVAAATAAAVSFRARVSDDEEVAALYAGP